MAPDGLQMGSRWAPGGLQIALQEELFKGHALYQQTPDQPQSGRYLKCYEHIIKIRKIKYYKHAILASTSLHEPPQTEQQIYSQTPDQPQSGRYLISYYIKLYYIIIILILYYIILH